MRLPCPFCGLRDHHEFTYEGLAAEAGRPALEASAEAWVRAVYLRPQPRGVAEELWRHARGCGSFVAVTRDNVTHEVTGARLFHPGAAAALGEDASAEGAPGVAPVGRAAAAEPAPGRGEASATAEDGGEDGPAAAEGGA